jgi:Zn-dependent protease
MIPEALAISVVILLFSVIIHEVMHGIAARYFGDYTAEHMGRITLNPLPHIDPIGTILIPLMLLITTGGQFVFGYAKPVPVNPLNFNNLRLGELVTSAAGIAANLVIALIGAIAFHLFANFYPNRLFLELAYFTASINLILAVFNLFPIPPLDGSKILMSQLSYKLAREYSKLEPYGFFLILLFNFMPPGMPLLPTVIGLGTDFLKTLLQLPA